MGSKVGSLISRGYIWGDVPLFIELSDWVPVSVYVYVCVCTCVYVFPGICACVCADVCVCVSGCIREATCAYAHIGVRVVCEVLCRRAGR